MDPLFERRELTKKVHIHSKFIQKNIQASILTQLKMNYEGHCSSEGFVRRDSITILNYSLGRMNYIEGGVDYHVTFQADICLPHPGQRFKASVKLRSKVGLHAEIAPLKVLIPRDLHFDNEYYDEVQLETDIEFDVVGCQFKQKDSEIIVLGKLVGEHKPAIKEEEVIEGKPAENNTEPEEEEKKVTVVPVEPIGERKKKKLRLMPTE
jgi:DNA-directed RNA polymerase subunit E'/Rpb7